MRNTLQELAVVAFGGGLGSAGRYLVIRAFTRPEQHSAWPVFAVNAVGSLLIGIVLAGAAQPQAKNWTLFLGTGFLGGFTTFSAFSADNLALVREGQIGLFALNALGQVLVGLLCAACGYWLGSLVWKS